MFEKPQVKITPEPPVNQQTRLEQPGLSSIHREMYALMPANSNSECSSIFPGLLN